LIQNVPFIKEFRDSHFNMEETHVLSHANIDVQNEIYQNEFLEFKIEWHYNHHIDVKFRLWKQDEVPSKDAPQMKTLSEQRKVTRSLYFNPMIQGIHFSQNTSQIADVKTSGSISTTLTFKANSVRRKFQLDFKYVTLNQKIHSSSVGSSFDTEMDVTDSIRPIVLAHLVHEINQFFFKQKKSRSSSTLNLEMIENICIYLQAIFENLGVNLANYKEQFSAKFIVISMI